MTGKVLDSTPGEMLRPCRLQSHHIEIIATVIGKDAFARVFESLEFGQTFGKPLGALGQFSDYCAMRTAALDRCVSRSRPLGRNTFES